jgi:hypothetical protein
VSKPSAAASTSTCFPSKTLESPTGKHTHTQLKKLARAREMARAYHPHECFPPLIIPSRFCYILFFFLVFPLPPLPAPPSSSSGQVRAMPGRPPSSPGRAARVGESLPRRNCRGLGLGVRRPHRRRSRPRCPGQGKPAIGCGRGEGEGGGVNERKKKKENKKDRKRQRRGWEMTRRGKESALSLFFSLFLSFARAFYLSHTHKHSLPLLLSLFAPPFSSTAFGVD